MKFHQLRAMQAGMCGLSGVACVAAFLLNGINWTTVDRNWLIGLTGLVLILFTLALLYEWAVTRHD